MTAPDLVEALRPVWSRVRHDTYAALPKGQGPRRVEAKLTRKVIAAHLDGGTRCGGYPIQPGTSTTQLAVLDLDSHRGETPWPEMQAVAIKLLDGLASRGLRGIPFRSSGGAGVHLYLLWDGPQDAYSVRTALRSVLTEAGLKDGPGGVAQGQVEVYPKQNRVAAESFGNQVWLPLAGKSCPLDSFELGDLPRVPAALDWPLSDAVPELEYEAPDRSAAPPTGELKRLRDALMSLPASYVEGPGKLYKRAEGSDTPCWMDIIFALHYESQGDAAGLAVAHEYSARMPNYEPDELDGKWETGINNNGDTLITGGTILKLAKEHGWQEDVSADFPLVEAPQSADGSPELELPKFERGPIPKGKTVAPILATIDNVIMAVERPDVCNAEIRYDEFRAEITVAYGGDTDWRPFKDNDYTLLRRHLERGGFKPISKELMRDAVYHVAIQNVFDSAIEWLDGLAWDGVKRVDHFIRDYFATSETPYTRAIGAYMWTALAGRVLEPGCQADMVPVLVGEQGLRKSSIVSCLAPDRRFFGEFDLSKRDDDQSRAMRGVLVGEISELRGLHTRDAESIKAFVTRRFEKWCPKYQEFETEFPRRLLFVGTTNKEAFLSDPTGDRRWLPLRVEQGDVAALVRDRDQLWAEGAARFRSAGVEWQEAERLARAVHGEHTMQDGWAEEIGNWLDSDSEGMDSGDLSSKQYRGRYGVSLNEVMREALRLNALQIADSRHQERAAAAMRILGYYSKNKRDKDKKQGKRWFKQPDTPS